MYKKIYIAKNNQIKRNEKCRYIENNSQTTTPTMTNENYKNNLPHQLHSLHTLICIGGSHFDFFGLCTFYGTERKKKKEATSEFHWKWMKIVVAEMKKYFNRIAFTSLRNSASPLFVSSKLPRSWSSVIISSSAILICMYVFIKSKKKRQKQFDFISLCNYDYDKFFFFCKN